MRGRIEGVIGGAVERAKRLTPGRAPELVLAETETTVSLPPLTVTTALETMRRSGGVLNPALDITWPPGIDSRTRGRTTGTDKAGRIVRRRYGPLEERWIVDPAHVPVGTIRHQLVAAAKDADIDWPDNRYEDQLRERDEAAAVELRRVTSTPVVVEDDSSGTIDEAERRVTGTVGGVPFVHARRTKKNVTTLLGLDDTKTAAVDGHLGGAPIAIGQQDGWIVGTIGTRPVTVAVAAKGTPHWPELRGTFDGHDVRRANGGAPVEVGGTTFVVATPIGFPRPGPDELVVWDLDATPFTPGELYLLLEVCNRAHDEWL